MADFLAENNPCGESILKLVSRSNAIIAEILRLKDFIPPVYRLDNKADQQKYGDLISDFTYFKNSEQFENKIDNDVGLQDLDEELRENYLEIITRFYLTFESIHQNVIDLNRFLEDLESGVYIQQTLEIVLVSEEGKQLLCEALYLYGVMLLLVDMYIEGTIRERLLVSYYRYSAQKSHAESNIDDVCKLLRSTGFVNAAGSKRAPHYPEDYFRRIPISENFINMVIGRLRSDDIYHQLKVFPLPEHRSTALANQAAMLVICLFFSPSILHNQTAVMREIVDKYFPDNWVINIYMGEIMNLIDAWDPYKAAKNALSNSLEFSNLSKHSRRHREGLQKLLPYIQKLVEEGAMAEDHVLDNVQKILNLVREANVTLRWLMLHTSPLSPVSEGNKKCRQTRDQILSETIYSPLQVFELLLNVAQFELKIKEIFKTFLSEKESKWENNKKDCIDRMNELSDVFSGDKPLTRIEKNENLQAWVKAIDKQIQSLSYQESPATCRKIIELDRAIEEVQEFHGLCKQLQVRQFLQETRTILYSMLRSVTIKEEISIHLQVIADMSYAWHVMDDYTAFMQKGIKQDPSLVVKLRATFLKMTSALEIPLLRINLARSPDLISVSQYYSNELVCYLRKVLHIIPETMFQIMAKIAHLQTYEIKEVPTRLDKDQLKEYAQLDHRFQVAKLSHDVSVLTEGITMMKSTLVGVIRIDPIQLLEDGIRKELVKHIATALHQGLTFNPKSKTSELVQKLETLGEVMEGHKRSFEYIQDYIQICGLQIWQEELTRIIGYNVEQECNSFLRNKISDWQSRYQSRTIPIPKYPPVDSGSVNFIGRLARELIRVTDPKITVYLEETTAWYDLKTKSEIVNIKFFSKITKSVGTPGLTGLDRLLSFMIASELQNSLRVLEKGIFMDKMWLQMFTDLSKALSRHADLINNPTKFYAQQISRASKVWPQLLDWMLKVGQMQLLRIHIAYELSTSCKFESPNLSFALEALNESSLGNCQAYIKKNKGLTGPTTTIADQYPHNPSSRFDQTYKRKVIHPILSLLTLETVERADIVILLIPDPAVLSDINKHSRDPSKPYPRDESQFLTSLAAQLDAVGLSDPASKIYVTTKNNEHFPLLSFLFTVSQCNKLIYSKSVDALLSKKTTDPLDGISFAMGLQTIFHQFHPDVRKLYLTYMGQYVKSHIADSRLKSKPETSGEIVALICLLEVFVRFSKLPRESLCEYIPKVVLDMYSSYY